MFSGRVNRNAKRCFRARRAAFPLMSPISLTDNAA
jgi:hypothetical protein